MARAAINQAKSVLAAEPSSLKQANSVQVAEPTTLSFPDGHDVTLLHQIGEGGFGTVFEARSSQHSTTSIACKLVGHGGDMDELADIAREVACQQRLSEADNADSSRFFVRLLGHYTEPMRSVLLLELVDQAQELENYVLSRPHSRLTERAARPLAALLIEAVAACHAMGVAHLDVTPRNVLIQVPESTTCAVRPITLKLIDFGTSSFFGERATEPKRAAGDSEAEVREAIRGFVRERGGAENYRSPERHEADDDDDNTQCFFSGQAADAYGVGATIFVMMTGRDAFDWPTEDVEEEDAARRRELLFDDIEEGRVPWEDPDEFSEAPPVDVSESARALVAQLLEHDPEKRPTMPEARRNPWLSTPPDDATQAEAAADVEEPVNEAVQLSEELPDLADGIASLTID